MGRTKNEAGASAPTNEGEASAEAAPVKKAKRASVRSRFDEELERTIDENPGVLDAIAKLALGMPPRGAPIGLPDPTYAPASPEEAAAVKAQQEARLARMHAAMTEKLTREHAETIFASVVASERLWHDGQATRLASMAAGAKRCAEAFAAAYPLPPFQDCGC